GMLGHAMVRSVVLILLGVYFSGRWELMNVLTQIGLGYTFLFLLWGRSIRTQAIAAAAILVGTWLLYILYPYSGINPETGAPEVGVSKQWAQEHLADVGPAWHKNANVGQAIDRVLLNQLPAGQTRIDGGYEPI